MSEIAFLTTLDRLSGESKTDLVSHGTQLHLLELYRHMESASVLVCVPNLSFC
jgi:hypothetical protein